MKKTRIRITDTTLRDAHQSLWATRMRTEDILPVLDAVDVEGHAVGAVLDVAVDRRRAQRKGCRYRFRRDQ